MRNLTKYILVVLASLCLTTTAYASPKGWEPVKSENVSSAKSVMKDTDLEIKAAPGLILISNSSQVQIKVFTILGRLVSNETLPPGNSRLQLPTHGVYIVKVGDLTCKVAV